MRDDFSFNLLIFGQLPTPPKQQAESSHHRYWHCNLTCCCLVFTSSNNKSPMRSSEWHSPPSSTHARSPTPQEADVSLPVCHILYHHITPTMDHFLTEAWVYFSSSFEEHFPTAPLDDDVWAEEQNLDRCLCIHERPQELNHQCSYPCPYDSNTTF